MNKCCCGDKLSKEDEFMLNWFDVTAEAEFSCSINVQGNPNPIMDNWTNCDCGGNVAKALTPKVYGRVAIVVDPLWRYEAYVVTRSLTTFFERYYRRMNLEVIYGGSPRSDFDVEKIAHMYGVDYNRMHKSPLISDPRNPGAMRHSISDFLCALQNFHPFSNTSKLDRVIIFMDNNVAYRASAVYPIIKLCRENNIPCVIIHSDGQYDEINEPFYDGYWYDPNANKLIMGTERYQRFNPGNVIHEIHECHPRSRSNYVYAPKSPKEDCGCCCEHGRVCRPQLYPPSYDYESRENGWRGEYYGGPYHHHRNGGTHHLMYDYDDLYDSYMDPCGRLYNSHKLVD